MAASVTIEEEHYGGIAKLKAVIVSGADGAASGTSELPYSGIVMRAVIVPASGADAPTDLFDLTVTDEDGIDVLCGQGANLNNAAPTTVIGSLGEALMDKLTITAAAMGDSNTATLYVFLHGVAL